MICQVIRFAGSRCRWGPPECTLYSEASIKNPNAIREPTANSSAMTALFTAVLLGSMLATEGAVNTVTA